MNQTVRTNVMKKMMTLIMMVSVIISMGMLTGCTGKASADLVVYGKIFTSERLRVGDGTSEIE